MLLSISHVIFLRIITIPILEVRKLKLEGLKKFPKVTEGPSGKTRIQTQNSDPELIFLPNRLHRFSYGF